MAQRQYTLRFGDFERKLLMNILMEYHNQLLRDRKPTEDVDALLRKVIDAPARRLGRQTYSEAR